MIIKVPVIDAVRERFTDYSRSNALFRLASRLSEHSRFEDALSLVNAIEEPVWRDRTRREETGSLLLALGELRRLAKEHSCQELSGTEHQDTSVAGC